MTANATSKATDAGAVAWRWRHVEEPTNWHLTSYASETDGNIIVEQLGVLAAPPTREQISRAIEPEVYFEYDRMAKEGRIAANGKPWADVAMGNRVGIALAKADAVLALRAAPLAASADAVRGIVARFHRNACYPDAMPHELDAVVAALTAPVAGTPAVTSKLD